MNEGIDYFKLLTHLSIYFLLIPSIVYWAILVYFNIYLTNNMIGYIALFSILTNLEILTIAFITARGVNNIRGKVKEYETKIKKEFIDTMKQGFKIEGFGDINERYKPP